MKNIIRYLSSSIFRSNKISPNGYIKKDDTSEIVLLNNAKIENSRVTLVNSSIKLGEDALISGYNISLNNATLEIGKNTFLVSVKPTVIDNFLSVENGLIKIGEHSRVMASEIVVRFGGNLIIGNYTAVNDGCDIRCDERIEIGNFNMISYECLVYDTNTHCIYDSKSRRQITIDHFPLLGYESNKPKTKPVIIGDDCWVGKRATILKGVEIGNSAIIGTGSVVVTNVPESTVWVGNPAKLVKAVQFDDYKSKD